MMKIKSQILRLEELLPTSERAATGGSQCDLLWCLVVCSLRDGANCCSVLHLQWLGDLFVSTESESIERGGG